VLKEKWIFLNMLKWWKDCVVDAIAKVCQYCCGFGYNFGSTNIAHILICILVVYMAHLR
jgi:hypothetical protein